MLDSHLLSVGRLSALERAAYLIAFLCKRAMSVGFDAEGRVRLPITQTLVADTLGLSIVHTNKTLRKLAALGLIRWQGRACEVLDIDTLIEVAGWEDPPERKRPFI